MSKFTSYLKQLTRQTPFRSAVRTGVQVFAALFVVSLIGFLNQIAQWAAGTGALPHASTAGKAAVSAIVAGLVAMVTFIQNAIEDKRGEGLPLLPRADDLHR